MSEFTDPITGADVFGDPTAPELGTPGFDASNATDAQAREESAVNETGTTTVGIATDHGVVVATDRRASLGGRFVSNKSVKKVEQIHPPAS